MNKIQVFYFLFSIIGLVGCSGNTISIQDSWARPAIAGGTSAIYFIIQNPLPEDDAMLGAECDVASSTELHMSQMSSDGTMSMHAQMEVPLPAKSKTEFKPGGYHIMLIDLKQNLKPGDLISLKLLFKNSGEILLSVPVKEP